MQKKAKTSAKVVPLRARTTPTSVPRLETRKAKALHQQDREHLYHGFVPLSTHQQKGLPIFVRGQGVYLWDTEGKR